MTPAEVVDHIALLTSLAPLDSAGVERVLGARLTPSSSSEYFAELTGSAGSFETVKMRVPLPGATAGPSVTVRLAPETCVSWEAIDGRFGHLFAVPNPHRANGPDVYRSQDYDDRGELYLSFDPQTKCLTEVNLHVK
ncbi:MAG: hypothetical protein ABMA64_00315 [Myxococcota bacterium]